ncbi:hypothetical protein [Paraburkholderia hayleyella]|uniref:hypothetical protein n=1 Tax=Paraburkholderia hayleyella TaxID=2152889 RepID=UPI0012916183|nr:hypothetical protein [Paraburkholderia hayleyella]
MLLDSGTLRASVAINKVTNALNKRANLENGKLGGKKVFITTPGSESALNYPCQINDISTPNYIAYSHSAQKNAIKSNNTEELSKSNQAALKFGIIKSLLENTQETEKFNFSENELSLLMEYAFDQNKEIPDDLFHEENAMLQFSHEKLKEKIIQLQNSQILAEISENSSSFNKDDISDSLSYVPVDPYAEYRGMTSYSRKSWKLARKRPQLERCRPHPLLSRGKKPLKFLQKKD